MLEMSDIERDGVKEMFNLSIGQAANALSQMVGEEIELSVPDFDVVPRPDMSDRFRTYISDSLVAVREDFHGPFDGKALLIFPEQNSLELVRVLLGDRTPLERMTDLEQEALNEVGNILLNACLGSLANLLGDEVRSTLPQYLAGSPEEVLHEIAPSEKPGEVILFLKIEFRLERLEISGFVAFMMDMASAQTFLNAVNRYFSTFA